jgi:circadian clock protein KaiC
VQRYIEVESRLRRVLAVVKVRASMHSNELRLFSVDDEGIRLGSMLADYEGQLGGRPTRRGTG